MKAFPSSIARRSTSRKKWGLKSDDAAKYGQNNEPMSNFFPGGEIWIRATAKFEGAQLFGNHGIGKGQGDIQEREGQTAE
jgi:hypothetical protein